MHEKHEYHVFHVDFERVEVPFIIALWIFVSSLAKIGKKIKQKKVPKRLKKITITS